MYVIKALAFANGAPCPHAGQFLKWFDFETEDGRGYGDFTPDLRFALKFASNVAAFQFWNTVSASHPVRADGRPNKPLTALSVEILTEAEAAKASSADVQRQS